MSALPPGTVNPPDAETFPLDVHQSLAALRQTARTAKSRAEVRRATAEEIALARTQRKPHFCVAHSARTGLPCEGHRITGSTVCIRHGGQLARVKARAAKRIASAVPTVIDSMVNIATQVKNLQAAQKAGADLLDRAGIGELVAAKVHSSTRDTTAHGIVVNIGFLQQPGSGEPTTITIPTIGPTQD